ncbi:riboflavin-specific deaminase [Metschnikowia bicuspidata var. bicuspidata NRRL YB-4993]|uniref:2,5-diamino-6-ribosylamino-4(3H)-pyrimidinone 5'-phosphate reductase n=1 Tax=Metschnikowia bicuspidata var. bicuspidata NRRL YB-4993 TaxID=869754 RepID=A0A1A0H4X8_9ASCO|nr:riboflavin-specific deaminase [Metschnikowia bicuspidata var. bicuspidata NRRL YB-4993]OBA19091.1 riboflavin-specific deaminase [Metschnikowia bicuspidata var. bicuspidata NRRL YB-4993]
MSLLPLNASLVPFLKPYLPVPKDDRPFVTLTWAQSLDSRIASRPGVQTKISHLETKTMTHYLRACHDAILVGVGTVLADDPKLNCRYGNSYKIRPVVVDPSGKWDYTSSTLCKLRAEGQGLAPLILVSNDVNISTETENILNSQDGAFCRLPFDRMNRANNWELVLNALHNMGIKSVMVEGGAVVINDLIQSSMVDSVVITVGPVFLGRNGVEVSPAIERRLVDVDWWKGQRDSVVAGRLLPHSA